MFRKITREKLNLFLAKYATKDRVLDIGSGGSSYDRYFPNRVSVDIDPLRKPDIVADAHNLPFKDGEFEFVLCTEVLEHLKDPKRAISEMNRVLNRGGMLVLTTRFVYPVHDAPNDYWRFTKYGLRELFKDWEVVELVPETETFSTIGVLLQRIAFQTNLKFKGWEHEKEWRILIESEEDMFSPSFEELRKLGGHNRKFNYPITAIKSIALGNKFFEPEELHELNNDILEIRLVSNLEQKSLMLDFVSGNNIDTHMALRDGLMKIGFRRGKIERIDYKTYKIHAD